MPFSKKKPKPPRRPKILTHEETEEFNKYVYQFENLAMEGGGSKGTAYVGAIRVSTEGAIIFSGMGVVPNIVFEKSSVTLFLI